MFLRRIVTLFAALLGFNCNAEYLATGSAKIIVYEPLPSSGSRYARDDEIKIKFFVDGFLNDQNFRVIYSNSGLIKWEGNILPNQSATLLPTLIDNQYVFKKSIYPERINVPIHETEIAIYHLRRLNQEIFADELGKIDILREKYLCLKRENIGNGSPTAILNCWSSIAQDEHLKLILQVNEISLALKEIFPAQQQYLRQRLDLNALSAQFCNQLNFDETEQKLIADNNQLILHQIHSLSACADGLGENNPGEFTYADFRKKIYENIPENGIVRKTLLRYWYETFIKEVPKNFIQTSYICNEQKEDWKIFLMELRKDRYNVNITPVSCNFAELRKVERIFQ
jgi:hypothetical protein